MRYLRQAIIYFLVGAVIFCVYEGIHQLVNGEPFVLNRMTIGGYLLAIGFGGLIGALIGLSNIRLMLPQERLLESKDELERLLAVNAMEMDLTTEPVTGKPGNRDFSDYFNDEWRRAMRHQRPITLVLCAVDLMGDAVGDLSIGDYLEEFLNKCVKRPADVVIRYSVRSVLLLLPDTSVEGAAKFVVMFRQQMVNQPVPHLDVPLLEIAKTSVGLASGIPIQGYRPEQMITAVEKALEQSRREGFIIIERPFWP